MHTSSTLFVVVIVCFVLQNYNSKKKEISRNNCLRNLFFFICFIYFLFFVLITKYLLLINMLQKSYAVLVSFCYCCLPYCFDVYTVGLIAYQTLRSNIYFNILSIRGWFLNNLYNFIEVSLQKINLEIKLKIFQNFLFKCVTY